MSNYICITSFVCESNKTGYGINATISEYTYNTLPVSDRNHFRKQDDEDDTLTNIIENVIVSEMVSEIIESSDSSSYSPPETTPDVEFGGGDFGGGGSGSDY